MSLLHLLPNEMLAISKVWIDPTSDAQAIIAKCDELKTPYKRVTTAHTRLSSAAQPAKQERIDAIIKAQADLDLRHDTIIRGCWGYLTGLAELLTGSESAAVLTLRDELIPDGLSSQNLTYGGEAGQAEQLDARMTATLRKRTDAILVGEGPAAKPLSSYIDEWISIGRQLGTYEAQRGTIESEPAEGAELHNARLDWIRAAHAMVSNAEMAELGAMEMATLFGGLQLAERKGDDRARDAKVRAAAEAKAAAEKKAAEEKAAADAKAAAEAKAGSTNGQAPAPGPG